MKPINRRQFLTLSAATTGAVLLSRCTAGGSSPGQQQPITASPSQYTSKAGLLEVTLQAQESAVRLGDRTAQLLNYNSQIPGPRLEARPGDTIRIHFRNRLSNPTNLHYHGLHVPPTGKADNIFLEILPGESLTYEFTIPPDHPASSFYYHPHLHGLVSEQIFGGLGGFFVVRGGLDEIPEIKAAQEEFLFLKDFALNGSGGVSASTFPMEQMQGREGSLITVNGQVNPALSLPAGGLLRWRLLNASNARFYRLALEDHPLYLIATDGGGLAEPVALQELLLAPGERAEVLVRGERPPGDYRLLNLSYDRGSMGMMGRGGMMGRQEGFSAEGPQVLATLTYQGQVEPLPLPEKVIPVEALPQPQTVRRFTFNHGMAPGQGMVFLINGKAFDPGRIDTSVRLNTVEDWEIVNAGTMDHPFHLHTNFFQVISRNGSPEPYRAWKDTVLVPVDEQVRVRVRFSDFVGKAVYHCHILDHEDLGMMGTVEITEASEQA